MSEIPIGGTLIAGLVFWRTGRPLFFWAAHACIIVDASVLCAGRVLLGTLTIWWRRVPATVLELRQDGRE